MKKSLITAAILFCASITLAAQSGPRKCEDLKDEIAKKLDAKGITGYTLTIVDKGKEGDAKVVGTCEGGTKSLLYSKGPVEAKPEAKPAAKPLAKPETKPESKPKK